MYDDDQPTYAEDRHDFMEDRYRPGKYKPKYEIRGDKDEYYLGEKMERYVTKDIKRLILDVIQHLKRSTKLSWETEATGSTYMELQLTGSHVRRADHDFLLCPIQVLCKIEPSSDHPCYCRVFITNKHELPPQFQRILLAPEYELTPSMFRDYVFGIFDTLVPNAYTIERKELTSVCPAYTIKYAHTEIDLVPCLQVQELPLFYTEWETRRLTKEEKMNCPIYVVPKKCAVDGQELELWRMSFSTVERLIFRDKLHPYERRLIKDLKMNIKKLKNHCSEVTYEMKLCSYHILTFFLAFSERNPVREENYLDYSTNFYLCFIHALQSEVIRHTFFPDFNLLQDVDKRECRELVKRLRAENNERNKKPPKKVEKKEKNERTIRKEERARKKYEKMERKRVKVILEMERQEEKERKN